MRWLILLAATVGVYALAEAIGIPQEADFAIMVGLVVAFVVVTEIIDVGDPSRRPPARNRRAGNLVGHILVGVGAVAMGGILAVTTASGVGSVIAVLGLCYLFVGMPVWALLRRGLRRRASGSRGRHRAKRWGRPS